MRAFYIEKNDRDTKHLRLSLVILKLLLYDPILPFAFLLQHAKSVNLDLDAIRSF